MTVSQFYFAENFCFYGTCTGILSDIKNPPEISTLIFLMKCFTLHFCTIKCIPIYLAKRYLMTYLSV